MVETFFKTLKSEMIWRTVFHTRDDEQKAITKAIRVFACQPQAWVNIPAKAIGREATLSANGFTDSVI